MPRRKDGKIRCDCPIAGDPYKAPELHAKGCPVRIYCDRMIAQGRGAEPAPIGDDGAISIPSVHYVRDVEVAGRLSMIWLVLVAILYVFVLIYLLCF